MKLAYFVLPHIGGTYTVFKHLRSGLEPYNIQVEWLGAWPVNSPLPGVVQDELRHGAILALQPNTADADQARQLAHIIAERGYDGVIINVLGDRLQTNIARYLPDDVLRIMVVHNITPGTYAAAAAIRDHVHVTVCVTERSRTDLMEGYGFVLDRIFTIANAVDISAFRDLDGDRNRTRPELRTLFVGRIEDASKGVLWLPDILDNLPDAVTLTVVGDGPDSQKLRSRLEPHRKRVHFAGPVAAHLIPSMMARHDVLIMPSRFEGLPLTLIEAMASGCVPVVSNIRGVTDRVVQDGANGLLFPVGHYSAAAAAIGRLHGDRDMLARMSVASRMVVNEHYGMERMAAAYNAVVAQVAKAPPALAPVLDFNRWSTPLGLRRGLRTYLPLALKNWLRVMRERI